MRPVVVLQGGVHGNWTAPAPNRLAVPVEESERLVRVQTASPGEIVGEGDGNGGGHGSRGRQGQAVSAAMRAFRRLGFRGVPIDDLTAAMGVSLPTLYAAFGDKHAAGTRAEPAVQASSAFRAA